eukprot:9350350-Alexandrium_andersonii.AAC.1
MAARATMTTALRFTARSGHRNATALQYHYDPATPRYYEIVVLPYLMQLRHHATMPAHDCANVPLRHSDI